jgi:hypothetical protein
MFLLIIVISLAVIIAFLTVPFVYFLANQSIKRHFAAVYGLIILFGGGWSIIITLFSAAALLLDFGGSFLGLGPDRSFEIFLKLTLWGLGLVFAIVLLFFAASLVDPGPQKRFLRKNSRNKKSK